ncbi:putative c6 finger domain-containing protein [Diaporthe ampelina]|uniref:Putative c6 finger domain-containing protein n=1 Tax=Diaporthe ampelina TaxID=1214573 RepID=A0A0G2FJ26_9PEZI|nr:putative c6 finger domain-containing protein [Diaporthe ampelina]
MMDLYWWFCKMDVYQSTLGASKLFMEFDLWTQCPPRAPINRIDQVGLSPPQEPLPSAEQILDAFDLETSTQKALEEWNNIMQAFQLFKSSLGPEFDPLSDDVHPREDSPFGPAWTYRAYPIAGIWMNFYMGLVILHRAHPSMPPFAMVAAHMIAKETDPYADEIGRIAAGVAGNLTMESVVSAPQSSALIECCFPIFVGAVQYRGKLQRQWAIRLLHQITRHTGWQTGDQIASGCEGAWRKAAAMGVAPVYEPESESDALRQGWTTRRLDERIHEVDEGHNRPVLQRSDRAHVAFGLLSVEDDMERLTLED